MPYHVSKAVFDRLVQRAMEELPEQFREFLEQVPVQIEWAPSPRMLRSLGLRKDDLLFGLYQGADLLTRVETEGRGTPMPNHILIFQEDHELVAESEEELVEEVRT